MARARLHDPAALLDAARALVLEGGAPAATIAAIGRGSGAPTGSIYHQFGSREGLLAQLWMRAARRSQERWLAALDEGALAAALSILDFAREQLPDARLLASLRREDLLGATADPALERLNEPAAAAVRALAARLGLGAEVVALATLDLPLGAVRRHLVAGRRPPATLRAPLAHAVEAVLDG